jgi:hypothetical protein
MSRKLIPCILLFLTFSGALYSAEVKNEGENLSPNSIKVSKEAIKINKAYIRELASGQENQEEAGPSLVPKKADTNKDIPFWYLNEKNN